MSLVSVAPKLPFRLTPAMPTRTFPKRKALDEMGKREIERLRKLGWGFKKIAAKMHRSPWTIRSFLIRPRRVHWRPTAERLFSILKRTPPSHRAKSRAAYDSRLIQPALLRRLMVRAKSRVKDLAVPCLKTLRRFLVGRDVRRPAIVRLANEEISGSALIALRASSSRW